MTKLTLISSPTCPYVQRAVIALKEKQVDHEVVYIDLTDKPQWFLDISPLGKVPVLKVEEAGAEPVHLFESAVIAEYLDETTPAPRFMPDSAIERARHRAWVEFASQLLGDVWKYSSVASADELAAARTALVGKISRLEAVVVGPLFAGDRFSLVDAAFASAFRQLDLLEGKAPAGLFDNAPRVTAWRQALAARNSVATAVPTDYAERFFDRIHKAGAAILGTA